MDESGHLEPTGAAEGGASTTDSPCTGMCELDVTTRLCRGCYRTLDEIVGWGQMSPSEQARVTRLSRRRRE